MVTSYTQLTNLPTLVTSYTQLTNLPTLVTSYTQLQNLPTLFDGNYNNLSNKLTAGNGISIDANNNIKVRIPTFAPTNSSYLYTMVDGNIGVATYIDWSDVANKPTLFNGDYNSLTNRPTIPAAQIQADWNQVTNTALDFIKNKPLTFPPSSHTHSLSSTEITGTLPFNKGGTNKTSMTANRLLGCGATANQYDEITIGSGLSLTGTTLSLSAGAGTSQWTSGTSLIYYNDGNVGIGTTAPARRLHLHNNTASTSAFIQFTDGTTTAATSRGSIIGKQTTQDLLIYNYQGGANIHFGTASTTGTLVERMTIQGNGNVGIGKTNPSASYKLDVNGAINATALHVNGVALAGQIQADWNQATTTALDFIKNKPALLTNTSLLFNNQNIAHETYQDFNNIPNFGFYFVQGSTNSPGTNSATQYYTLTQGLGSQFPWTGAGSYGMQIGIPRNVTSPYISIRYKENNTLGSWQRISAGQADKLTTARTINGVAFDGTQNITISTSQWTTSGTSITYNSGNVGIGITPQATLHVYGKAIIHGSDNDYAPPANGQWGGSIGTKLVLYPGNSTACAYSLGIEGGTLWYCSPGTHKWYSGTKNVMTLTSGNPNSSFGGDLSVESTTYSYGFNRNWQIAPSAISSDLELWFRYYNGSAYSTKSKMSFNGNGGYTNFTGSHRNISDDKRLYNHAYKGYIVRSIGKYKNLNSKYHRNYIQGNIIMDDALPIVELSTKAYDKSVWGVISSFEDTSIKVRNYEQGHFISCMDIEGGDYRLQINGCGEGSIWVSNYNGNLENGDHITTSPIPGIGMKQDDDILRNYTVAKITMDCNFDPQMIPVQIIKQEIVIDESGNEISKNVLDEEGYPIYEYKLDTSGNKIYEPEYEVKTVTHNDIEYKMAFVGCTYKCS